MECIRMRNWVTYSVIKGNDIETCSIYDFRFQFDGKIGEAIYIGTSSNQWTDGEDGCNYNLVTSNRFELRGNECVDVKEENDEIGDKDKLPAAPSIDDVEKFSNGVTGIDANGVV
eukprot:g17829.t1